MADKKTDRGNKDIANDPMFGAIVRGSESRAREQQEAAQAEFDRTHDAK